MKPQAYPHTFLIIVLSAVLFSCETKPYETGPDRFVDDTGFKVVGYLSGGSFDVIDDLELDKLTHLNLAFANPAKGGGIEFERNADIKPIVAKGHAAGLKVYVSLAGGGRPDTTLWKSALLPENMPTFVATLLQYVEDNVLTRLLLEYVTKKEE